MPTARAGPTVDVLIDVVGYNTNAGLQDLEDPAGRARGRRAPIKTVLGYELENTEASPVGTYELIRTVWELHQAPCRHVAPSRLERASVTTGPANAFCHYQLRIDGRATTATTRSTTKAIRKATW